MATTLFIILAIFSLHSVVYSDDWVVDKSYVNVFLQMLQSSPRPTNLSFTGDFLPVHDNTITFSCHRLFLAREFTPITWPPPKDIPHGLKELFTMYGAAQLSQFYLAQAQNGGAGYNWDKDMIVSLGEKPNVCGPYGSGECRSVMEKFAKPFIIGKSGVVVGSQSPWAEAALLAAGAAHVTTIEYMNITTNHDQLSTMTPEKAATAFLAGKFRHVDFIFSYSSIEHNGLGRYGDPINPAGDLEAVAQMHCMLKKNGILFLAVPVCAPALGCEFGQDQVQWNAHRIYGKTRLMAMLSYWKFLHIEKSTSAAQPIFVLQKVSPLHESDKAINMKLINLP